VASITIQRRHRLGLAQARERVGELAHALEQDLEATWQWQGDELRFERAGASGCVRVDEERLDVEVKLGLLLRPFRERIAAQISDRLDSLIGPAV
jgi:putative polyhydroxyalkanoate system protein